MKSKSIILLIFAGMLISCNSNSITSSVNDDFSSQPIVSSSKAESGDESSSEIEFSSENPANSSSFSSSSKNSAPSSKTPTSRNSSVSSSTENTYKYSLEEWTTFKFYDEYGPAHNPDWTYYYGTSKNPNGVLFACPNEKAEGDGVHFEEKGKQYMISPTFKSWEKVEVRFKLWFSSKTSDKYKATKNQPQIKLDCYNSADIKLSTKDIELTKSNIRTDGYCYECKVYILEAKMSYFIFNFNNTIDNGNSGYTIVVHEVSMKGWPYSN